MCMYTIAVAYRWILGLYSGSDAALSSQAGMGSLFGSGFMGAGNLNPLTSVCVCVCVCVCVLWL